MPDTANLKLPYPVEAAPADVPLDIQALAEAIDAYGLALATPGDLKLSAAIAAPAGWLVCDGRAVSRGTYAALFAAIGTSNGAGDGSTTFNLPDGRGRALIGAGTGTGLTARALGAKGGEETHTLTGPEAPSHNHSPVQTGGGGWAATLFSQAAQTAPGAAYAAVNGTIDVTNTVGGDAPHNNMPPFVAVNVLIKT